MMNNYFVEIESLQTTLHNAVEEELYKALYNCAVEVESQYMMNSYVVEVESLPTTLHNVIED